MNSLARDDLLDLTAYEKVRKQKQSEAIEARKLRRVNLGDLLSLAFENRFTVWYQIMEMIRAERLVDEEAIRFELDTYNPLIPGDGELSATLFIEIADKEQLRKWLPKLPGIEQTISLEIEGAGSAKGIGEEGRSKDEVTATVHYIRFPLTREQASAMVAGAKCRIMADHPEYRATAEIAPDLGVQLGKEAY